MSYTRRVLHYSPGPADLQGVISERAIAGCWFELDRQGGCGQGELRLNDSFAQRNQLDIGDWIALEYAAGQRWYLGRIVKRQAKSPAGVTLHLEGMAAELGEVFPGGFGRGIADGTPPHRYAQADLFPNDPDHSDETVDSASEPHEVVALLMQQYAAAKTHIAFDPSLIEPPAQPASLTSVKFRGEESVRAIVQELAVRSRNASWGVDETGAFFFLQPRSTIAATYREGVDLLSLEEGRDRRSLFNRVLLAGGLVYDEAVASGELGRGFFRWHGNYIQPESRAKYGERQIRLWVPWIRTRDDSREFIREFFRLYAEPTTRYRIEVLGSPALLKPWAGRVRIQAADGSELLTEQIERLRVHFDHVPRFEMEVGPADPRTLWSAPPHAERFVLPSRPAPEHGGGDLVPVSSSSDDEPSPGDFCGGSPLLCDRFTDGDGTRLNLHTMPVGTGWSELSGAWEIHSKRARCVGAVAAEPRFLVTADAGAADVRVSVVLNPAAGASCGIAVRVSDVDNFWLVDVDVSNAGNPKLRVLERNGGVWIERASITGIDAVAGSDRTLTVTAAGATITGELEDGSVVNYGLATHNQAVTRHGLRADAAGCEFDDFRAENV